jgi:L-ribulose-5-phosphate 3-epimerase
MIHMLSYRIGTLQNPHLPLPRVAELGIGGLELAWTSETSVDAVRAAVEPAGLQVTSIHAPAPMDDEKMPQLLASYAGYAAALGAQYLFVSVQAGEMPREAAYGRLRQAGDAVGEHGVFLAMETHPDLCQNGDNMLNTMAAIDHPWVGINYDTANIYYYNEQIDTVTEVTKAARCVRGVHVKDTFGGFHDGAFPVFGEGIVDFAAVGAVLDKAGYQGPYCMELEGGTFGNCTEDELAAKVGQCAEHLRAAGLVA